MASVINANEGSRQRRTLNQQHIHDIFEFYANFGRSAVMTYQESLDSFMFHKMCRECPGLLDPKLTSTEIDIIFMKAKPKFERRLQFTHFLDALSAISEKKYPDDTPADGLRKLISHHLAPLYDIVQVEMQKTGETEIPLHGIFKKLYDVRSYTGVYAERFRTGDGRINGETDTRPGRNYKGSTNTGTDEIIHDMSVLMRPNLHGAGTIMSPANHVLMKRTGISSNTSPTRSRPVARTPGADNRPSTTRQPNHFRFDESRSIAGPPALTQEQIKEMFEFYANFGRSAVMTYQESLDSFMFHKMCRECPGLLDSKLTSIEIDLIFMKAKPKFERRLQFTHFLDALSAISEKKYPDDTPADGLRKLISHHLAPLYDIVQIEMQKTGETEIPLHGIFKKLYDVRSYTGVYAERFRTGDGRINGETDNRPGRQFMGNTNSGTDEIIHDISVLMRPNLRSGTMMVSRKVTPGGSPRRATRSVSPQRRAGGARPITSPSVVGSLTGRSRQY